MNLKKIDAFFLLDRKGKFTALDGVRGWAVFMVFMLHFAPVVATYFGPESQWKTGLMILHSLLAYTPFFGTNGGNLGVDLLFILSGFLIFGSIYTKKPGFNYFMKRRWQRLLPAHIIVIMSSLTVTSLLGNVVNIFFLNLFFPSIPIMNFVTWAVTYELIFYALCGLWFIKGAKIKELHTWRFLIFALLLFVFSHKSIDDALRSISTQYVERDRFIAFFFGIGLGKMYFENKISRIKLESIFHKAAIPSFICALAMRLFWDNQIFKVFAPFERLMQYFIFDVSSFFIIGALVFAPRSLLQKVFNVRSLRVLGAVSYSLFLSHAIWGVAIGARIADSLLAGGGGFKVILYSAITFATTLAISVFMFHFLEKPYYAKK